MSTYVVSDIHGQFESYKKLLGAISFKERDKLYILGDVLDRGPQSCEVLLDIMHRPNVTLIAGNHEYAAMLVLPKLLTEITAESIDKFLDDTEFMKGLLAWLNDGGQATIDSFRRLSKQERQAVLDYLGEVSLYEELEVNGQKYVLVHAGLSHFSPKRPIEDFSLYELIFERT